MRSCLGVGDSGNVKKDKAIVTGMRGNRKRRKHGGVNFVARLLADGVFVMRYGDRQLNFRFAVDFVRPGDAAENIVTRGRSDLFFAAGDQFNPDRIEHQRLVTVIGNDDADGQKPVIAIARFEDSRLVRSGEGINGDGHLLVIMRVTQGIACGGARRRRIESLVATQAHGGQEQKECCDPEGFHCSDYQMGAGFSQLAQGSE